MNKEHKSISKFLSLVLRHQPETIQLTLDPNGWAAIDELITNSQKVGKRLNRELLLKVVANNDKQRFSISNDGLKIRANQGHSVSIDLDLQPVDPPSQLYHGTVAKFIDSIRQQGLKPGNRNHVHLSKDVETATTVGKRRGRPIILLVDSAEMHRAGFEFYRSDNGVWLTETVPAKFIVFPKDV